MSWPPMMKSAGSGSGRSRKGGKAVTSPVRSDNPRAIAASPRVIVVPTPPNAPTSQSPTRRRVMVTVSLCSCVHENPGATIRRDAANAPGSEGGILGNARAGRSFQELIMYPGRAMFNPGQFARVGVSPAMGP